MSGPYIEIGEGVSMPLSGLILDSEGRMSSESFGFFIFSWKPRRCRNGRWRWLRWLEDHGDGTFTLGNRAH